MTQETKAMPGKQMKQRNPATATTTENEIAEVEQEILELDIPSNNGVFNKIEMVVEKLASNRVVQKMLEKCDIVLKIVEDTARWGLPQDENDAKLERPLPWIFFLSLIISLRVLYFWLNMASVIVGTPRVTPQSMVNALQAKRRRLRAIRMRGIKSSRRGEEGPMTSSGSSGKAPSLTAKVTQLFGRAVCRPGQMRDVPNRHSMARSESLPKDSCENQIERCSSKRPRDEESTDLNLTVDQMLEKYANDDSEDDSDYVPDAEVDDDNESSTSCTSSMSSEEETEKESVENIPALSQTTEMNSLTMDQSIVEIKENGSVKQHRPMPKPLSDIKMEPMSEGDDIQTPKENEALQEIREETTEVETSQRNEEQFETPLQKLPHKLTVTLDDDQYKKSTPGHESAAALKATEVITDEKAQTTSHPKSEMKSHPKSNSNKCITTITTETCIEYDWSIVIKTEISHRRQRVQLPKLDCSVQTLTPASSSEDIFYSPIGSPTDFHSMFHPAPLINNHPLADHSTPKEDNSDVNAESPPEEKSEWNPMNQRNKSNYMNSNKQQHYQPNYYNNKYRNKNRR